MGKITLDGQGINFVDLNFRHENEFSDQKKKKQNKKSPLVSANNTLVGTQTDSHWHGGDGVQPLLL